MSLILDLESPQLSQTFFYLWNQVEKILILMWKLSTNRIELIGKNERIFSRPEREKSCCCNYVTNQMLKLNFTKLLAREETQWKRWNVVDELHFSNLLVERQHELASKGRISLTERLGKLSSRWLARMSLTCHALAGWLTKPQFASNFGKTAQPTRGNSQVSYTGLDTPERAGG